MAERAAGKGEGDPPEEPGEEAGAPGGSRSSTRVLCALALVAMMASSAAVRLDALSRKHCLEHDEAVSYLAAAAKESAWFEQAPADQWVPASAWLSFFEIDHPFAFRTIQRDLIERDMHPPLYFWLLHLAALIEGIEPRTGGDLNVLLHLMGMGMLFALALRVGGSEVAALIAVGLWSFSPAVISTTLLARQYELYALLTMASLLGLLRLMEAGSHLRWAAALTSSALLAALLTHYQVLLLLPVLAAIAAGHWAWLARGEGRARVANRHLFFAAISLVGAGVLYLVIQPSVFSEIEVHLGSHTLRPRTFFNPRWLRVGATLERFFPPPIQSLWSLAAVGVLGAAWLGAAIVRVTRALRGGPASGACWSRGILYAFVPMSLLAAAILVQYASFRSPQHAMGDRYLAMVWPLLALCIAVSLTPLLRSRWAAVGALLAALVWAQQGSTDRDSSLFAGCIPGQMMLADRYPAVVVDSLVRGQLPRLFPHLSADSAVYAGRPEQLFAPGGAMLEGLAGHSDALFVHLRTPGAGQRPRGELADAFRQEGYQIGAPDDPGVFLTHPSHVVVLAATEGVGWPEGLLAALDDLGARTPAIRSGAAYAAILRQGRLLAEQVGYAWPLSPGWTGASVALRAHVGPPRAAMHGDRLTISIGEQVAVRAAGGLAVVVYDLENGRIRERSVHPPDRGWEGVPPVFRVWRP